MHGPEDYHAKWKSDKDKYHMISILYEIFKKWYNWTFSQNKQIHRLKWTHGYQRGKMGGGINWELGLTPTYSHI